ncbi:hypothetical protein NKH56_30120 [Mesorhizobium sp. M1076]|uniref:hypothetical protein n=1 Tax=Mesorhizobium sp. M1076 TaxID=2957054 RepID=UPI0033393B58
MTGTVPTDRIAKILEYAGYRSLKTPLVVAGIPFAFSAAMVGTEHNADLVVIADATETKDSKILSQIEGLARALDALSSLRPLTLVLSGIRPATKMLDSMAGVCRVLLAENASSEADIKRRLAILLPLKLPDLKAPITDILGALQLSDNEDPVTFRLLAAASIGTEEVKDLLFSFISEPFADELFGEEAN